MQFRVLQYRICQYHIQFRARIVHTSAYFVHLHVLQRSLYHATAPTTSYRVFSWGRLESLTVAESCPIFASLTSPAMTASAPLRSPAPSPENMSAGSWAPASVPEAYTVSSACTPQSRTYPIFELVLHEKLQRPRLERLVQLLPGLQALVPLVHGRPQHILQLVVRPQVLLGPLRKHVCVDTALLISDECDATTNSQPLSET